MTHIQVKQMLGRGRSFAGRDWWYDFRALPQFTKDAEVKARSGDLMRQFSTLTKNWNSDLNSEWVVRHFFAVKMVLGSSVMAQSLRYAEANNLRPVVSYLSYYTVMHALRAILFTSPQARWNDGEILQTTHTKTINVACDAIAHLNKDLANQVKASTLHLKAFRELISYRAPSSGDNFEKPDFDVYAYCRLFLEIAQMQSELLEASIQKNVTEAFELDQNFTQHVYDVEMDGVSFFDREDWHRIGYLARKHPAPLNILHMMSDGHVEDFFGSWCGEDDDPAAFNPDNDWRILFDVP
ncbi:TPA: hypothetical protein QDZ75_002479 [Stenotrophomonas maltophilia]|jgi:hypothetical protein|uniref:Uncharacterized protein n=1 Tax=Stenotrophomonas maltophilia TaxID=40324 RepID=A0A2J0U6I6_STEMA|nr:MULTISPECIES: hypothetical protein [Stenotrophomonas]PJL24575.1 hypothetical protein B9Y64_18570 [Stenotrophomonas maltophilia]HDS1138439.1 hypothetical protein [Stenotrophomonas maltophilia]HDS1147927.1 hypothetical protein [Stenotrophomonas maltophilia]HDS1163402.1 hypothetical protein [Stenotrophomonas maltophilia]HEL5404196.1 hypothetical protein [Stenotrophomonas maltophilia]